MTYIPFLLFLYIIFAFAYYMFFLDEESYENNKFENLSIFVLIHKLITNAFS